MLQAALMKTASSLALFAACLGLIIGSSARAQTPASPPGLTIQGSVSTYDGGSATTQSVNQTQLAPFSETIASSIAGSFGPFTNFANSTITASADYGSVSASLSGNGSGYGAASWSNFETAGSYATPDFLADSGPGAAFSDTLTITSATLAAGTAVQVQFTEILQSDDFSFSATSYGGEGSGPGITELAYVSYEGFNYDLDGNPGLELDYPAIGQTEGYIGDDFVSDTYNLIAPGEFSETTTATFDVGQTYWFTGGLQLFGAASAAYGEDTPYSYSIDPLATTLVDVLTPGAGYTSGSGTVYDTTLPSSGRSVPDGGMTIALLGGALAGLSAFRRRFAK